MRLILSKGDYSRDEEGAMWESNLHLEGEEAEIGVKEHREASGRKRKSCLFIMIKICQYYFKIKLMYSFFFRPCKIPITTQAQGHLPVKPKD